MYLYHKLLTEGAVFNHALYHVCLVICGLLLELLLYLLSAWLGLLLVSTFDKGNIAFASAGNQSFLLSLKVCVDNDFSGQCTSSQRETVKEVTVVKIIVVKISIRLEHNILVYLEH